MKYFECSICETLFSNKRLLKLHKKKHNKKPIKDGKTGCMRCGRRYLNTNTVKAHSEMHQGIIWESKDVFGPFPIQKPLKIEKYKEILQ